MRTLSNSEARRFYDRFGARQDKQGFYEAPALQALIAHGNFVAAQSVFELGCGTGQLAQQLLHNHLPSTATYRGVDISATMVSLAADRLSTFSERAVVTLVPGDTDLPASSESADRFVATYVFDLLSESEVQRQLGEAHRILQPGGLLCLSGITPGTTVLSRIVMGIWNVVFRFFPSVVGGCRPLQVDQYLLSDRWQVIYNDTKIAYGIASGVTIARRV